MSCFIIYYHSKFLSFFFFFFFFFYRKDPFHEERATGDPQEAHTSNFLHPVYYYYNGQIPAFTDTTVLPRPTRLHHMVEDFLAEWFVMLFDTFLHSYLFVYVKIVIHDQMAYRGRPSSLQPTLDFLKGINIFSSVIKLGGAT